MTPHTTDKGKTKEEILASFDSKRKELIDAEYKSEHPVEFGYKWIDPGQNEIHEVVDWGNLKTFLSSSLDAYEEHIRRETVGVSAPQLRKGQTVFNFLEWLRVRKGGNTLQSKRMADPFYIEDSEWDKLFNEFLSFLKGNGKLLKKE